MADYDTTSIDPEYDFIVVGGGSAGCVVAARLAEDPSVSVLLLEAGQAAHDFWMRMPGGYPHLQRGHYDWQLEAEPHPATNHHVSLWPRGKVLGGSSAINAMFYVRGHPENYNEWRDKFGCDGWGYDDVLPFFKLSENCRLRNADDKYHGRDGPLTVSDSARGNPHPVAKMFIKAADAADVGMPAIADYNGKQQEGASTIQATVERGERCSTVCFLDKLPVHNLHVATLAHVSRVITQGNMAIGVAYKRANTDSDDLSKVSDSVVYARKEVILCAGAVHTPTILMLSGIGPREHLMEHNIPVVADLPVGKNLEDHLLMPIAFKTSVPTYSNRPLDGLSYISQYVLLRRGVATGQGCEAMSFARTRLQPHDEKATDLQIHFIAALLHGNDDVMHIINGSEKRGSQYSAKALASLRYQNGITFIPVLLQPHSRGSIRLRSSSPHDKPLIEANYLQDDHDVQVLKHSMDLCRKIAKSGPFADVVTEEITDRNSAFKEAPESDEYKDEFVRNNAFTIYHPACTTRMGPRNDGSSVVDCRLRVHGMQRLRVSDCGVMPRVVSGNTNAPTIMIAERCAAFLREQYGLSAAAREPTPAARL
eukprot:TRINITY_DN7152_c0_g1_i1.p1 TRINITY_DN7152_c0_g1~~TRINITY_DN7152_c0_g1_i1.p1  ORF type:complete len:594 (+),score=159.40 TRINITY_DN7152_c0_g1_i1:34-1815(+)